MAQLGLALAMAYEVLIAIVAFGDFMILLKDGDDGTISSQPCCY
jgi:hypothetical protein